MGRVWRNIHTSLNSENTILELQNIIEKNYYSIPQENIISINKDNFSLLIDLINDINLISIDIEWRPDDIIQSLYGNLDLKIRDFTLKDTLPVLMIFPSSLMKK